MAAMLDYNAFNRISGNAAAPNAYNQRFADYRAVNNPTGSYLNQRNSPAMLMNAGNPTRRNGMFPSAGGVTAPVTKTMAPTFGATPQPANAVADPNFFLNKQKISSPVTQRPNKQSLFNTYGSGVARPVAAGRL